MVGGIRPTSTVDLYGTVVSVNDHSACCVFVGIRRGPSDKTTSIVEFRRSNDPDLAEFASSLDRNSHVRFEVDPYTIGTTRFAGKGLTIVEQSH